MEYSAGGRGRHGVSGELSIHYRWAGEGEGEQEGLMNLIYIEIYSPSPTMYNYQGSYSIEGAPIAYADVLYPPNLLEVGSKAGSIKSGVLNLSE